MKRIVLSLLVAALCVIVTPAAVLAEDEPSLDLATTNTNQCPTCGPVIEVLVYLDQNLNGSYNPPGDGLEDTWKVLMYAVNDGNWTLINSAITGGSDGAYYSGSDTGKVWFRPLQTGMDYVVCAEFPRDWLFMTQPTASGSLEKTGGWNAVVEVVPNPFPLAWDDPEPGARNWDETPLCYKVQLKSTCNNVKLRFGILTYDTFGNPVMF